MATSLTMFVFKLSIQQTNSRTYLPMCALFGFIQTDKQKDEREGETERDTCGEKKNERKKRLIDREKNRHKDRQLQR